MRKIMGLLEILGILLVLHILLRVMETPFQTIMYEGIFQKKMVTMVCMTILTGVVLLYAKCRKISLSVFPSSFSFAYIMATVIAAAVLIITPSNFIGGVQGVLGLVYGSIVTPVFEELLFRGMIWNQLASFVRSERNIFLIDAGLFSIWHLGYMVSNLLVGDWFAVSAKLLVGLVYGIILGLVRLKTKNCYSTILVHGIMNAFL